MCNVTILVLLLICSQFHAIMRFVVVAFRSGFPMKPDTSMIYRMGEEVYWKCIPKKGHSSMKLACVLVHMCVISELMYVVYV